MRLPIRIVLGVALLSLLAPPADAEEPGDGQYTVDNAALHYYQALMFAQRIDERQLRPLDDWQTLPLAEQAEDIVSDADHALAAMHRGAAITECDWGLDPRLGPELLLPHLRPARHLVRGAGLRGRLRMAKGEVRAALDDWAAAIALSRHLRARSGMPCFLTGVVREGEIIDVLLGHVDELSKADRQYLRQRWQAMPEAPSVADVVAREGRAMTGWLRRLVREDRIDELYEVLAMLHSIGGPDEQYHDRPVRAAAGHDKQKLLKMIDALAVHYGVLAEVMRLTADEFDGAYTKWRTQFNRDADPLSKAFMPAYRRVHGIVEDLKTKRAALSAKLE